MNPPASLAPLGTVHVQPNFATLALIGDGLLRSNRSCPSLCFLTLHLPSQVTNITDQHMTPPPALNSTVLFSRILISVSVPIPLSEWYLSRLAPSGSSKWDVCSNMFGLRGSANAFLRLNVWPLQGSHLCSHSQIPTCFQRSCFFSERQPICRPLCNHEDEY